MLQIATAFVRVKLAGEDGGETLRSELANLGPVFCKVGQTLATRPDIVGAQVSSQVGQGQGQGQGQGYGCGCGCG